MGVGGVVQGNDSIAIISVMLYRIRTERLQLHPCPLGLPRYHHKTWPHMGPAGKALYK